MLVVALLPVFVAVNETASFTRAAARLDVTQSTISQQCVAWNAGSAGPCSNATPMQ